MAFAGALTHAPGNINQATGGAMVSPLALFALGVVSQAMLLAWAIGVARYLWLKDIPDGHVPGYRPPPTP